MAMCGVVRRTDAREELRLQLGTLRFDLGVLGESLGKDKKKEVQNLKKTFFAAVRAPCPATLHAFPSDPAVSTDHLHLPLKAVTPHPWLAVLPAFVACKKSSSRWHWIAVELLPALEKSPLHRLLALVQSQVHSDVGLWLLHGCYWKCPARSGLPS